MIWVAEGTGEETLEASGHRRHWSVLRKLLGLYSSGPRITGRQKRRQDRESSC